MNPLTNVKNITKLNQIELKRGTVDKKSWHDIYKESAWIFIGGLAYGLTEGDILSVFSQYGEIVNINLVRDKKTGKIKGFCFLCYANQKSTILAVDNFNGIKVCGRTIRVDHVANYKPPKENEDEDDITKQLKAEGCAPKPIKLESLSEEAPEKKKSKKVKKEKKKHKKHKKMDIKQEGSVKAVKVKQERYDPGYAKYELSGGGRPNRKIQRSEDSESSSDESSGYDSSRLSNRESPRSKATRKDRMHSSFESKSDEPNRSKIYRNKDTHKTNDFKRRHDDSSSDESGKRKKSHKTDFYKSKRPESSMHQSSTNAENSPDSSNEYKRYRTTNQRKSKESKNYDRSISPIKDKHSNKHSHKHKRHDSSPSTESDTAHKQKVRESEKSHSSQYEDRVRKGSHHKNYKDSRPSSSTNYFTDSDEKYKRSEQSHENGFSSPYKQNKNHSHVSRSSKAERKER